MLAPATDNLHEYDKLPGVQERRDAPRRCWNMPAKIYHQDTFMAVCIIKDISCGGAKLLFDNNALRLTEFRILLPGMTGPVGAATVWERGTVRGVRFVGGSR